MRFRKNGISTNVPITWFREQTSDTSRETSMHNLVVFRNLLVSKNDNFETKICKVLSSSFNDFWKQHVKTRIQDTLVFEGNAVTIGSVSKSTTVIGQHADAVAEAVLTNSGSTTSTSNTTSSESLSQLDSSSVRELSNQPTSLYTNCVLGEDVTLAIGGRRKDVFEGVNWHVDLLKSVNCEGGSVRLLEIDRVQLFVNLF